MVSYFSSFVNSVWREKGVLLLPIVQIRDALWGFPLVSLLVISGGYFTLRTKGFSLFPFRICRHTVGTLFQKGGDRRAMLAAVSTAIGGTVGVGSITGVAYGIAVGGAGSVFWMWVSGFFGMALKYAEVFVAVRHRKRVDGGYLGGTPFALADAGHKKLGVLFALLCVFASFGVGNLAQIGSLTETAKELGIPAWGCGLVCTALLAFAVFGGRKRIGTLNTVLVPVASTVYLLATVWIVLTHLHALPDAFGRILKEAFGMRAAWGGISGSLLANAMRVGFARGVFSNEAGVGSSPLAHAASGEGDPQTQGEWGAFEILADTFLVSTLTSLALLCVGAERVTVLFHAAFGTVGTWGFALLMAIFAFASVLSWCYYSEVCLAFLRLPHGETVYRLLTVATAFAGACVPMQTLWASADILNALMIFPNLFLLFLKRNEITYLAKKERNTPCGIANKKKPSCRT